MRKIEWEMKVDPMTFQPLVALVVEGKSTGVHYTIELMQDLKAQYGDNADAICDVKGILDEEMTKITDLTPEERAFALGDGFKPKPFVWHHNEE